MSQSRVAESLTVLLHVAVMRTDTSDDLSFAMIHALQLAETGRTIQDRRIGKPDGRGIRGFISRLISDRLFVRSGMYATRRRAGFDDHQHHPQGM